MAFRSFIMVLQFHCTVTLLQCFCYAHTTCVSILIRPPRQSALKILAPHIDGLVQCHELQAAFPKAVIVPQMSAYHQSLISYWSRQEQQLTPSCILTPHNAQHVSKALRILSQYQAAGNATTAGCQFAIRGAGPTPWAGSANINNGVTIGMGSINTVDVNPFKTLADGQQSTASSMLSVWLWLADVFRIQA